MSNDNSDKSAILSSSFNPSSWSSSLGVADAIASYRRSQVIITGQSVSSRSGYASEDNRSLDEEANYESGGPSGITPEGEDAHTRIHTSEHVNDDLMSELGWEEDTSTPLTGSRPASVPTLSYGYPRLQSESDYRRADKRWGKSKRPHVSTSGRSRGHLSLVSTSSERTPLLSPSTPDSGRTVTATSGRRQDSLPADYAQQGRQTLVRKPSAISTHSEKRVIGRSTFGQTLFNSIAILLGFGMLSEPLAFAHAGWFGGMGLIVTYGYVTCYTAKILANFMIEDPHIHTYADIGIKAFGKKSKFVTSALFCLELLAVCVVLITLYGDSLHSVAPSYSANTYKLVGLIILTPTLFMPLSILSYASMLGILSTLLVIFVLLFDGLTKAEAPGSLWDPATTSTSPAGLGEMGVAFGLFMAGFSGHAVLPSLARDMAEPQECDRMFNWAFTAATVIYALIGSCGYLMFGNNVSDEVSQDLLATPGYNIPLNHLVMWSLVIMPLTKFALSTRPVNITLEILLGVHPTTMPKLGAAASLGQSRRAIIAPIVMVVERILFATLAVGISIFIPEFSAMMAFLGSFSAFMLCVIGPVAAKVALTNGKIGAFDAMLLAVGAAMMVWGTGAAFMVKS